MKEMTEKEYREFLFDGAKTGKLATARKDGSPHVFAIWYDLDGKELVFTTGGESVKALDMKRNPRVCVSIDDHISPYSFVMIEGTVSISEDPGELFKWATRIGARHMGEDEAEAYGKRNSSEGEILARISPDKILAYKDVAS